MDSNDQDPVPRLAVVIVNWNRREHVKQLLSDLRCQTERAEEILVVDNGSTDGSQDMIEQEYPEVCLLRLRKNMGLSYARNLGIVSSRSELIGSLDNDVRVLDKQFLAKVRRSSVRHPDCGVISFHLVEGLWRYSNASGLKKAFSMEELEKLADVGRSPVRENAFYEYILYGGSCVIKREVIRKVGVFDDGFWYGGEECDFAYRCHRAGVRLLRDRGLWLIHLRTPDSRVRKGGDLALKNYVIAQSRYLPPVDLCIFLILQFLKCSVDAIKTQTIKSFFSVCWEVAKEWRFRVSERRNPVSRETMWYWYYLRVNQPERFPSAKRIRTTPFRFYLHRARKWIMNGDESRQFVTMLSEATPGQDFVPR